MFGKISNAGWEEKQKHCKSGGNLKTTIGKEACLGSTKKTSEVSQKSGHCMEEKWQMR